LIAAAEAAPHLVRRPAPLPGRAQAAPSPAGLLRVCRSSYQFE